MSAYSKLSLAASGLLLWVLTAGTVPAQRKPISTNWIPVDNSFKTAVQENMKKRLNGLDRLYVNNPADAKMVKTVKASFQEAMADSNASWESEVFKLQHDLLAAAAESELGKTALSQVDMELKVITSQKANLEDEIRETRRFIAELDSTFRSSKEQYKAVYNNYRRYYVVVARARMPEKEAEALRSDSLTTKLEPAVFEIAQKRGVEAFLESRSLLETENYANYIVKQGVHCVAGMLTPPRGKIRNSGGSDKWTYFVVYGLYVQPKTKQPGPDARERKIPAGWDVSVQITHDVLEAKFAQFPPDSLSLPPGKHTQLPLSSGGVVERFHLPSDAEFQTLMNDVVGRVGSFIDPRKNLVETWKAQVDRYGQQLLRTLERKSVLETNLVKLNRQKASYGREIEELEKQREIQKGLNQQNEIRESQAKERWISNILNRKIIYFEDSKWTRWEEGTAREASDRQVENLLSRYINNAQKRYLDSVTAYVRDGAKVTFERQNTFGLEPSDITRYKILYYYYDTANEQSKVGLAVEFNMKLDERYFIEQTSSDPGVVRARARIDSKRGFVVYNNLAYAKAANVFETWAQASAAADKANAGGLNGYRTWRVPTKEELEKIMDLSKEKGPMTFFPELGIDPEEKYWTKTVKKKTGHGPIFYIVYFNRTAVVNEAHRDDGAAYLLVADLK